MERPIRSEGLKAMSIISIGALFAVSLCSLQAYAEGLGAALDLQLTRSPGTCQGGSEPGEPCFGDACPGGCFGGGVPGEPCFNAPAQCRGRCSAIPTIRCSSNSECIAQLAGTTCNNPPPGTCTNPSPGTCLGSVQQLSWSEIPGAIGYDVVEGWLNPLQEGTFTGMSCQANDLDALSLPYEFTPDQAFPLWFLVREVYPASNGTYDEGGMQVGSRDDDVTPEASACP